MDCRVRGRVNEEALTLIELLVVVAIIGLLAALIVPVVGKSKGSASRISCIQQLRQYGMGQTMYAESSGLPFPSPDALVEAGLISDALILLCPLDRFEGYASRFDACHGEPHAYETSYETLHRFTQDHKFVRELERADPNHGIAACRLHGWHTEHFVEGLRGFCGSAWLMFEGPLLRLRKDGSVQTATLTLRPSSVPNSGRGFSLWSLFTDEPNPFPPHGSQ